MSDDPLGFVVKLDDNEQMNLSRLFEFWRNKGFIIENRSNHHDIDIYSEYIWDGQENFSLNHQTYNDIYLPNANSEIWVDFGKNDKITEYYCIFKPGDQSKIRSTYTSPSKYEFFIGISYSFLSGKILIISMMNHQFELLIEDENNQLNFWDIFFEFITPLKIIDFSYISSTVKYFVEFFIENNKEKFKEKFTKELKEDRWFTLNYYNKEWTYQDYLNTGVLNHNEDELYLNDYLLILIANIYVEKFSAPAFLIEKCLNHTKLNYPNSFILNHYK